MSTNYVRQVRAISHEQFLLQITLLQKTIEIEVANEQEFNQVLLSNKVAGAQSDRLELTGTVNGSRSITPNSTNTVDISHHNWGLAASTQNSATLSSSYTYNNLGANVDCVIMDTGIVLNHPEFNDQSNVSSRINQINWGGSQGGSFYTCLLYTSDAADDP